MLRTGLMLLCDMFGKRGRVCVTTCFCMTFFCFKLGFCEKPVPAPHDIDTLRALVINRPALRSFRGAYMITQEDESGGRLVSQDEYRFEGDNRYLTQERMTPGQPKEIHTFVQYQGKYSTRGENDKGVAITLSEPYWPLPVGARLNPPMLYGEQHGYSLGEILSEGDSTVVLRDNMRVLSHRFGKGANCLDIYIDENDRIKRIESVDRLVYSDDEIRMFCNGDLFDVRQLRTTMELDGYQEINGIEFPAWAQKTWWRNDMDYLQPLLDLRKAGGISELEYAVRFYTEVPCIPASVQTLTVDLDNVEVNIPLTVEDFALDYSKGTSVYDRDTDMGYIVEGYNWLEALSDPMVILVLIAMLVIASVLGREVWKKYARS